MTVVMYHMAIQADDRGPVGQFGIAQFPRAVGIDGCYQVANAAVEVSAVAAQAIVHQQALVVVLGVEKDLLIGSVMQARRPLRPFLLMAILASLRNAENVSRLQPHLVRHAPADMVEYPAHVIDVEPRFQREDVAVASAARNIA